MRGEKATTVNSDGVNGALLAWFMNAFKRTGSIISGTSSTTRGVLGNGGCEVEIVG